MFPEETDLDCTQSLGLGLKNAGLMYVGFMYAGFMYAGVEYVWSLSRRLRLNCGDAAIFKSRFLRVRYLRVTIPLAQEEDEGSYWNDTV